MKINPVFSMMIVLLIGLAYMYFLQSEILAFTDEIGETISLTAEEGLCTSTIAGTCAPEAGHGS